MHVRVTHRLVPFGATTAAATLLPYACHRSTVATARTTPKTELERDSRSGRTRGDTKKNTGKYFNFITEATSQIVTPA